MIVLDTHALIWWVNSPSELSAKARRAIETHAKSAEIAVSAISVFEIATLVRRRRLEFGIPLQQWLGALRSLPELRFEPVSDIVGQIAGEFGESMHGDPGDRIIAATALSLNAKLVTADSRLLGFAGLQCIW